MCFENVTCACGCVCVATGRDEASTPATASAAAIPATDPVLRVRLVFISLLQVVTRTHLTPLTPRRGRHDASGKIGFSDPADNERPVGAPITLTRSSPRKARRIPYR